MKQEVVIELSGGKKLTFETGKLAKQAHGSCVVRIGDNVVLATAVSNTEPREGIDFFPLTVDYREYTYAGGRIPGGFIKREGRPSEREILTSRVIDRPIRPLFPEGFHCETQVIAFVLSADTENDPDVAAINQLREKVGKPKREVQPPEFDEAYYNDLKSRIGAQLAEYVDTEKHPKAESYNLVKAFKKELVAALPEDDEEGQEKLKHYFEILRERIFREQVIGDKRRPDRRAFDQIRPIWIEVGGLPRTHGSAIFTRG